MNCGPKSKTAPRGRGDGRSGQSFNATSAIAFPDFPNGGLRTRQAIGAGRNTSELFGSVSAASIGVSGWAGARDDHPENPRPQFHNETNAKRRNPGPANGFSFRRPQ